MDLHLFILLAVALVANAVEAMTGFGSTIITVTVCANFYDIDFLVPALVPANILLSTYIAARHFRDINRIELFRRILPFVGVGVAGGLTFFLLLDSNTLKLGYGIFVLVFSIHQITRQLRNGNGAAEQPLGRGAAAGWLLAGGLAQGLFASGGPMVVFYAGRALDGKAAFRATLSALWLIVNVCMSVSYAVSGKMTAATLATSAKILPVIAAGIFIGEALHARIPERAFRIAVYALLIFAGAALIIGS